MATAAAASSMDRITQWVSSSQEVPPDLTVRIADAVFPLHKAVMVPKCGYIRRAIAAASQQGAVELDLSALPGGAEAFGKAARHCYGGSLDLTPRDAAPLGCAAAFLDAPDLGRRADDFLARSALRTLPGAAAVLRSCEPLLPPAADDDDEVALSAARRAADAVALALCNEALLFPTAAQQTGWWAAELAALSPASLGRVVAALRCRRAGPDVLAAAAAAYAERVLADVLAAADAVDVDAAVEHRALLEAVVAALPPAADAPLPAALLCRLLHAAATLSASAATCRDVELRLAAVLDQATAADLLCLAGARAQNADTVRRVVAAFVERHHPTQESLERVARAVDEAAAGMAAAEPALPIPRFVGVLGAVPREARRRVGTHDGVYRAVDVYLKAHPGLDEIEREKVCGAMDPLRLSRQARLHAAQNRRLPLQAVLSALYYDQLKLRSADGGGGARENEAWETESVESVAGKARAQAAADAALARENEALRAELARMRAYVSGMQPQNSSSSKGSGSSSMVPAPGKKAGFLGSVSRTLSRLNPFRGGGGWAKDTGSIADGRDRHVVKPKRRRFSIG